MKRSDIFVGTLLLLLGTAFLLRNLRIIDFHLSTWWPTLLIVWVVASVLSNRRLTFGNFVLLILGVVLQILKLKGLSFKAIIPYWPVLLILAGIWLIAKNFVPSRLKPINESSELDLMAFLGSSERRIRSRMKEPGRINVFFGSAEVDLTEAEPVAERVEVEVTVWFGSVEMRIPTDWEVAFEVKTFLASAEDRTKPKMGILRKKLVVKGFLCFGSLEVVN